jgi:transcriptional antiterminator
MTKLGKRSGKKNRLDQIRELRERGISTPEAIADHLNISVRTAYRDLQKIRNEARYILQDLMQGEFIVEFHDTLNNFKSTVDRCKHEMYELENNYRQQKTMILQLLEEVPDAKIVTKANLLQTLTELEAKYHSSKQAYERMIKDTVRDSLSVQSKTELVWAFDSFVKKNNPTPITSAEVKERLEVNTEEEDDK